MRAAAAPAVAARSEFSFARVRVLTASPGPGAAPPVTRKREFWALMGYAAVPGAVAPAPFSVVLLAAFLTQVGTLQIAPILIAVITAFLTMEAVKYLLTSRKQAHRAAAKPAGPA